MQSSDLHSSRILRLNGLRRNVRIGSILTVLFLGLDLVGVRTPLLLPKPAFCRKIEQLSSPSKVTQSYQDQRKGTSSSRSDEVCLQSIIKPYSPLSGSATVLLGVYKYDGSLDVYLTQLFIAKNLGPNKHNDTPGDWIFLSRSTFSPFGWRTYRSADPVASWSSNFYTLKTRQALWHLLQDYLLVNQDHGGNSTRSLITTFLLTYGLPGVLALLAAYLVLNAYQSHGRFFWQCLFKSRFKSVLDQLSGQISFRVNKSRTLLAGTSLLFLLIIAFLYSSTSWLLPRPFWCNDYRGGWKICIHEVIQLPTKELRTIVLGVSVHRPDLSSTYASMQVFTALAQDNIGFVDVPGSWHFLDRSDYSHQGFLKGRSSTALSSIVDPLVPASVQAKFWNSVAHDIQSRHKAFRRLSLSTKLLEVSSTYLFLLISVFVALWTAISVVELVILSNDTKQ